MSSGHMDTNLEETTLGTLKPKNIMFSKFVNIDNLNITKLSRILVSFRATQLESFLRMMEEEVELLVKLLFIFGLLFLLWVGQEVVIRFAYTSKEEYYQ